MTIEEMIARQGEIREILESNQQDLDLDALEAEAQELRDSLSAAREETNRRRRICDMVAGGAGTEMRDLRGGGQALQNNPGIDSAEYRRAYLLHLADRDDEMTREERDAYTHTTVNTPAPVPTSMLDQIWDLVSETHAILGDISVYRTGAVIEVTKHTSIVAGAAKSLGENTANDDEQNTFVKVTLSGKDFAKTVEISYASAKMSIPALEKYLVQEIARGVSDAMAADVVDTIIGEIAADNQLTTASATEITYPEVCAAFGLLKRVGRTVLYATRATVYNHLVGMVDGNGRPIFQPSLQAGAEEKLLGATIRFDDALDDGVLLIGDPSKVLYNMVQDVIVETDKDIKKHVFVHSAYARGSGTLIDDKAFAMVSLKSGS